MDIDILIFALKSCNFESSSSLTVKHLTKILECAKTIELKKEAERICFISRGEESLERWENELYDPNQ